MTRRALAAAAIAMAKAGTPDHEISAFLSVSRSWLKFLFASARRDGQVIPYQTARRVHRDNLYLTLPAQELAA